MLRTNPVLVLSALSAVAIGRPAVGQTARATLGGRVVVRASNRGVASAQVTDVGGRSTLTDSAGRFLFRGDAPGTVHLVVRAIGYDPRSLTLTLRSGDSVDVTLELDPLPTAQTLPSVSIDANAVSYRLRDFERRRRTGIGQYLTDDEIRASSAANLQDLTRGMRGVTLNCGGTLQGGCRVQMVRAPQNCQPDYVVDGRVDNIFGPTTPIRDIVGLEVYTGPSDVPGEFAGSTAGCGVIAIWTRSGPVKRGG